MKRIASRDVTFYIPVRNAAKTLEAAVASVRAQTVQPADLLLVVDQRSTDASGEVARASGATMLEQRDGRLGHARNLAIENCHTPWLASCDADVALEPDWLAALLEAADDQVAAVGGCTHERLITPADRWRSVNMPHNWGPLPFDDPFMLVSEMIARRDALRAVGGYRPDLFYGDDSDLCRRLRDAGFTLRYEPAAVAWHHRADSVESVLDLRWGYSFNRQRYRLEGLAGIIDKLAVNRVYTLQGLSQTLHSEYAETSAISLLLWFHHAMRDLRCVLELWPLVQPAQRDACRRAARQMMIEQLRGDWLPLAGIMPELLPKTLTAPDCVGPTGLSQTAGHQHYLDALASATNALLTEIPPAVADHLVVSVRSLATGSAESTTPPSFDVTDADHRALAATRPRPAWRWPTLKALLPSRLDSAAAGEAPSVEGYYLPDEMPSEPDAPGVGQEELILLPHLEHSPDPRGALRATLAKADAVVVAYQPPTAFVASVPVLSARDLAQVCAEQGFAIRDFQTEAGLTRLIVQRQRARKHAGRSDSATAVV